MTTTEIPTNDALQMVWAIREKIYEETKNMNHEEYNQYLRIHVKSFEQRIAKARAERIANANK